MVSRIFFTNPDFFLFNQICCLFWFSQNGFLFQNKNARITIYLYWKQKKNPEKASTNNSGSEEQIKYKQVFLSWKKYTFIHVFCFHTILNLRKRLLRLDHCCVWLERARCHGVICRCHLRPQWRVTISHHATW